MHPLLFKIGSFEVHTYGVMIVTGFLVGLYLIYRQAKREGINPERIVDISFWGLFAGLLGGRVVYIVTRADYFLQHPLEIFKFWEGGLVFYGGFVGGAAAFWYFTRKYKLNTLQVMDMAVPSLAIAHFFGRLGCFSAGCCYGRLARGVPWAVTFKDFDGIAPMGVPLHPAQLYDAFNALIIFSIVSIVQRHKRFTGQVLTIYMVLYSIGRSIVESYRGDGIRGFVIDGWLSTSQFISIFIFSAGVYFYIKWSQRGHVARQKVLSHE